MHWKKDWYSLMGPLNIWAAFMAFTPIIVVEAIISIEVLPQHGDLLLRIVALVCTAGLVPLAILASVAPPFVTREEVSWRNRNAEALFEDDVTWEDVPFLRPVLNRVRSTTGKRRPEHRKSDAAAQGRSSFVSAGANHSAIAALQRRHRRERRLA